MRKSKTSVARTASNLSEVSGQNSQVLKVDESSPEALRRYIRLLRESNGRLEWQVELAFNSLAGIRHTSQTYSRQLVKNIKQILDKTSPLVVQGHLLTDSETATVYIKHFVDNYLKIQEESEDMCRHISQIVEKNSQWSNMTEEAAQWRQYQKQKHQEELDQLKEDIEKTSGMIEAKNQESEKLRLKIAQRKKQLQNLHNQLDQRRQKVLGGQTTLNETQTKLTKAKQIRQALSDHNILLTETLSRKALLHMQQQTRKLQQNLSRIEIVNMKLGMTIGPDKQNKK